MKESECDGQEDVMNDEEDAAQLEMFRTYSDPGELVPITCDCVVHMLVQLYLYCSVLFICMEMYILRNKLMYIQQGGLLHSCCVLCAGRKRSLRSLEIPLDNLLSGIIFLSGKVVKT